MRVTKNKALTSYFLNLFGYNVPDYTMVYSDEKCSRYKLDDTLDRGLRYANNIGYPVILKINDSSKGRGIYKVFDEEELIVIANSILAETNTFQIQRFYSYNDYRVVVLGEKVISAYQRIPLYIVGDGVNSIKTLIMYKQQKFIDEGRDTIIEIDDEIEKSLSIKGYNLNTVLKKNEKCTLRTISNLSAGGECIEISNLIHDDYINLCLKISKDLNLKLCGIDIMCQNICDKISDYVVLEVNSAPGLDNYAYVGKEQEEYVKRLYTEVIRYIKTMQL